MLTQPFKSEIEKGGGGKCISIGLETRSPKWPEIYSFILQGIERLYFVQFDALFHKIL